MDHVKIPWQSWVVVCDGGKALVLRNEGDAELLNLQPVEITVNPDPPTRELGTDRPGRVHESGGVGRSSVEATDFHEQAEAAFLSDLVLRLDTAARENEVSNIILVAPPKALGILRKHLTPSLAALIHTEVAKDFAHLSTPEIEKHLAA